LAESCKAPPTANLSTIGNKEHECEIELLPVNIPIEPLLKKRINEVLMSYLVEQTERSRQAKGTLTRFLLGSHIFL
jgi:hypothetical protein